MIDISNSECYICLESINNGQPLFELECCKNTVHLGCLKTWLDFNRNRTKCFVCNKYNKFCDDMTRNLNSSITVIASDASDISNNSNIRLPPNRVNKELKLLLTIGSLLFIISMPIIFSFDQS